MKKVVVGMSGGVDSSVAAYLLKEQGYDVTGVTMQIWQSEEQAILEDNGGCCGLSAVDDARRVAGQIGIPYYVMNFRREFKEKVIDYFTSEYQKGRTPNPCIACNRYIKWESLYERARAIGADYIATGHYARIEQLENGRFAIRNSVTAAKDQTYALYNLTQDQLEHTLMPIGSYTKDEVRKIANDIGLNVAYKKDSQEICFIPDNDYAGYIKRETGYIDVPGNFIDTAGNVLGRHQGIIHYTVGQRKGLGIALGRPMFVVAVKPDTNEVVLGSNDEVFGRTLYANHLNFMGEDHFEEGEAVTAKIRYSHGGAEARLHMVNADTVEVTFTEPVRAITPGQAAVFYKGEVVVGGGIII